MRRKSNSEFYNKLFSSSLSKNNSEKNDEVSSNNIQKTSENITKEILQILPLNSTRQKCSFPNNDLNSSKSILKNVDNSEDNNLSSNSLEFQLKSNNSSTNHKLKKNPSTPPPLLDDILQVSKIRVKLKHEHTEQQQEEVSPPTLPILPPVIDEYNSDFFDDEDECLDLKEDFFNVKSDDEKNEIENELCKNCEVEKLRSTLEELLNIDCGYKELLDKLARKHSELEIRSQLQHSLKNELKQKEKSIFINMGSLGVKIHKLKEKKKILTQKNLSSSHLLKNEDITTIDKLSEIVLSNQNITNNLSTTISSPKMKRIISKMRCDIEKRKKRIEILEECFGSGRTLESETKAQLGYLPTSIRYYPPEKKTIKFLQFYDEADHLNADIEEIIESERADSAETFEEIMLHGRNKIIATQKSPPKLEFLFHTPNSDIDKSSEAESIDQNEEVTSFSSSNKSKSNVADLHLLNDQIGVDSNSLSVQNVIHTISTSSLEEINNMNSSKVPVSDYDDKNQIIQSDISECFDKILYMKTDINCTTTTSTTIDMDSELGEKKHIYSDQQNSLFTSEMIENLAPAKGMELKKTNNIKKKSPLIVTLNNLNLLPKNVQIPENIRKLAQSILDINSNIALHKKQFRQDEPMIDFDDMNIETEVEEEEDMHNVNVVPQYLVRSSMSSSSLDDQRDYTVVDFPQAEAFKKQQLSKVKRIRKINFDPSIIKYSPPISRHRTTLASSMTKTFPMSRLHPPQQLPTKLKLIKNESRNPPTPRKRRKYSKTDMTSILSPKQLTKEGRQLRDIDDTLNLNRNITVRKPYQISMLDFMDAMGENKNSNRGGPPKQLLGLSNIMDIKKLYKNIQKKEKEEKSIEKSSLNEFKNLKKYNKKSSLLDESLHHSKNSSRPTTTISNNQRKINNSPSIVVKKRCPTSKINSNESSKLPHYLKPCDRIPKNNIGHNNDEWISKTVKLIPVKDMPSYLRFGLFNNLIGRNLNNNPSTNIDQKFKGNNNTLTKNNVLKKFPEKLNNFNLKNDLDKN